MRLLLCNADILIYHNGWSILPCGYVGVDGSVIDYVGTQKPTRPYDREKQLSGHLIMPGLYNTHTHSPMTLLRGIGSDLPLDRWLHEAVFPVEAKLTPEDISAGTRIAMMEFLASGVVSFSDMYDMPQITAQDVERSGMKACLDRPILSFDPDEPYEQNWRATQSRAFFKDWHNVADGRIKVDFAIHAEYTSTPRAVRAYGEDCIKLGARMHLHLSETRKEHEECKQRHGKTPARYFYDLGVFNNPTTAAHCVWVEHDDISLLAEKGVTAAHNPSSNMKLGSGFMPLQALLAANVNVTLGTDGAASNNNLNQFEEMHLCSVLHNGFAQDPTIITPDDVLSMTTRNGAKAQGRTDCGEIAVGKRADLVALNMRAPHLMPALDVKALLVYAAQASDVAMTMVDGRILYENGEFLTIDRERAYYDLQQSIQRLY